MQSDQLCKKLPLYYYTFGVFKLVFKKRQEGLHVQNIEDKYCLKFCFQTGSGVKGMKTFNFKDVQHILLGED